MSINTKCPLLPRPPPREAQAQGTSLSRTDSWPPGLHVQWQRCSINAGQWQL